MVDLSYENDHWMGYSFKEYREKYKELLDLAIAQEFELKLHREGCDNVREPVPAPRGSKKKGKGSH